MKITILTLFPEMFDGFLTTSIIKKAILQHRVSVECVNIRDYTLDKHTRTDDAPFGGGAGLVMQVQPVADALAARTSPDAHCLMMTPQGKPFTHRDAHRLAQCSHDLVLICGHYEGFDERIRSFADEEVSIGDYVLTGGELPAMVISDAIIRLLDEVIAPDSSLDDSFENGLLEYPQYTRPAEFRGMTVPEVLLSGNHELIRKWRLKESLRKTLRYRPDLLRLKVLDAEQRKMLRDLGEEEACDTSEFIK